MGPAVASRTRVTMSSGATATRRVRPPRTKWHSMALMTSARPRGEAVRGGPPISLAGRRPAAPMGGNTWLRPTVRSECYGTGAAEQ